MIAPEFGFHRGRSRVSMTEGPNRWWTHLKDSSRSHCFVADWLMSDWCFTLAYVHIEEELGYGIDNFAKRGRIRLLTTTFIFIIGPGWKTLRIWYATAGTCPWMFTCLIWIWKVNSGIVRIFWLSTCTRPSALNTRIFRPLHLFGFDIRYLYICSSVMTFPLVIITTSRSHGLIWFCCHPIPSWSPSQRPVFLQFIFVFCSFDFPDFPIGYFVNWRCVIATLIDSVFNINQVSSSTYLVLLVVNTSQSWHVPLTSATNSWLASYN